MARVRVEPGSARVGDVVTVVGVVARDVLPGGFNLEFSIRVEAKGKEPHDQFYAVRLEAVESVTREWAPEPGGRAAYNGYTVHVVAVDGDAAWVRYSTGKRETVGLRDLGAAGKF